MKHPDPEIDAIMQETLAEVRAGRMTPAPLEPWWELRRPNEQTADYLGRVLEEAGLPDLAANARAAHYDDWFAPPEVADGFELVRLVRDLRRAVAATPERSAHVEVIENAVRRGEFDGTKAESDRWAAGKAGQDTFRELLASHKATTTFKAGRNDPCPCGSGRKFKRCHGSATQPPTKEESTMDAEEQQEQQGDEQATASASTDGDTARAEATAPEPDPNADDAPPEGDDDAGDEDED